MSKGRLGEKLVQRRAVDWLESHYRNREDVISVATKIEARIRPDSRRGFGRADGLVVAQLRTGRTLVASLEAKSHKTRHNVRARVRSAAIFVPAMVGGVTASSALYITCARVGEVWPVILSALAFAVAFIVCGDLASRSSLIFSVEVIRQVMRYPGHERWIAIPAAMLRDDRVQRGLQSRCRHGTVSASFW